MKRFLLLTLLCYTFVAIHGAEPQKIQPILPEEQVQVFLLLAKQLPTQTDIFFANIAHELVHRYPDITRKELVSLFRWQDKEKHTRASLFKLPVLQQIWHHIEKEKTHVLINTIFPITIDPEVYDYYFTSSSWQDKSDKLPTKQADNTQACLSSTICSILQQLHQKTFGNGNFVCRQYTYIGQITSITSSSINGTNLERDRTGTSEPAHILLLFYGSDHAHAIMADQHNVFVFPHINFIARQTDERTLLQTIQAAVEEGKEVRFANLPAGLDYVQSLAQQ